MDQAPPAVRILPMTNDIPAEFPGCENIGDLQQNFFLNELPSRNGKYYYRKSGLKAEPGTIVLFQCKACIIASATLIGIEKTVVKVGYDGYLNFDAASIRIFKPINADAIMEIWPDFIKFNQTKQELKPPENYSKFLKILEYITKPELLIPVSDGCYLPSKKDFEVAYRALSLPGGTISIDSALDQLEIITNKKGLTLKSNWRVTTEKNIEIWSKK